jgi:two-component system CheB/CheR fusion protein
MASRLNGSEDDGPINVVALGGSAGSLEALQAFLAKLPAEPGLAFVVVTHHPPGHRTYLPQILAEHTGLTVREAEPGEVVAANHVYVLPSGGNWGLQRGCLVPEIGKEAAAERASQEERPGRGVAHPVDAFFRSLAAERGHLAIGIVLSGTGTDGTLGLRAIKSEGGMVMAQELASAGFRGMPASAIGTNLVDYVLAPEDMPPALLAYVEAGARRPVEEEATGIDTPEPVLEEILSLVAERTGHDFSGYKRNTLVRRLERRMNVHGIEGPHEYLRFLQRNPAETDLLFKEVIISVTDFFRDPEAWQALAEGPLRERLEAAATAGRDFRAWVVGCATGEEAYTLAILVHEALQAFDDPVSVQIFATDVDTQAVETARVGRYPAGIAEDLSKERLRRYFIAEEDTYRVSQAIRDMVVFADHNVLWDPPFTRQDLITCRNLLIYLERDQQRKLVPVFQYSLQPKGVLFLGPSESLDDADEAFTAVDRHWRIFRVEEDSAARLPDMPSRGTGHALTMFQRPVEGRDRQRDGEGFTRSVERLLAHEYAPASVVINDRGEALYFHGRTGRYLEPASGPAQNQLLEMARGGLRAPLMKALREVAGTDDEPLQQRVWVQTDGQLEEVLLEVRPVSFPRALRGLRVVSFRLPGAESGLAGGEGEAAEGEASESPSKVTQLQRELEATRQDKQVTVEELQSSNEELQSMNEELHSMNEELQSSNEELEVSKEEVESLNEELRSVNVELEARVSELAQASDDMKNLLDSTEIALLFLDEDLHVKRFTEAARELIALREPDIGRPIHELSSSLRYENLEADAGEVLDTLEPKEVEVQAQGGHWYLLRIMPYRTSQNVVSGLVCVFKDIQGAKRLEVSESLFRGIVETVREPLLVLDPDLRVVTANDGFYRAFPLRPEQVDGRELFEVGEGQWDHPELQGLLREVLPSRKKVEGYVIDLGGGDKGSRQVSVNARQLQRAAGEPELILLTMDVDGDGRGPRAP